jgi:hypothetical protein
MTWLNLFRLYTKYIGIASKYVFTFAIIPPRYSRIVELFLVNTMNLCAIIKNPLGAWHYRYTVTGIKVG